MKVTNDGIEIDVTKVPQILQAARMIEPEVAPPTMCYYSKLKPVVDTAVPFVLLKVTYKVVQLIPTPMPKPICSLSF